jgi:RHS repeat-associated protein
MASLVLGNGLFEQTEYNERLQPVTMRLHNGTALPASGTACGSAASGVEEWCIALSYGAASSSNVGNIAEQTILAKKSGGTPGHLKLVQQYGYDYAHRLTTTAESVVSGGDAASPAGNWSMVNSYDRFGNRWATGSGISLDPMTPSSAADLDGATNRVKSSAGAGYDSAGYMTTHTLLPAGGLGYDAEGRLATYGTGVAYGYDGEGRRVKKSVTAGATTTVTYFIYDGSGSLAQEIGGSPQTSGVRYLTADHLGTTRVITDGAKAVKARCDYMPFGQVLLANQSTGQRNVIPEYACGEDVRQRFTGKERDGETGLDYFGARYLSSAQGRFTSPDPMSAGAEVASPQSWNG